MLQRENVLVRHFRRLATEDASHTYRLDIVDPDYVPPGVDSRTYRRSAVANYAVLLCEYDDAASGGAALPRERSRHRAGPSP